VWVEGADLRWIDASGVEQNNLGSAIATPGGAVVGSWWDEADLPGATENRYIDASGVERAPTVSFAPSGGGVEGSIWVEGAALKARVGPHEVTIS
jgi:hypothetical protein